jgi:transposase
MVANGIRPAMVSQLRNVSRQSVSQWTVTDEAEGAQGWVLGYRGSKSYRMDQARAAVIAWIKRHESRRVAAWRDHLDAEFAIVYQSTPSYSDRLEAGGMRYHQSEKLNPKRAEAQGQTRREDIKKPGVRGGRQPTRRGHRVHAG